MPIKLVRPNARAALETRFQGGHSFQKLGSNHIITGLFKSVL
jgi:hypothetical protein